MRTLRVRTAGVLILRRQACGERTELLLDRLSAVSQLIPCNHPDTWWVVVLTATVTAAVALLLVWLF
ncbi:hypothetical protein GCM10009774_03340 [Cellulomonas gelida]|uniref:Uncharacterized protein n=1 Tax=Cellulomonas gelida TaxID=1712 RepID=A0A4Y3KKY1_9CELL|nr:hypothetical protein CGE01nite_23300 [Cellulomonas gelida]GGL16263.1 hypothetical protein GCM10009774_03340 [Cellulomonas gelida]